MIKVIFQRYLNRYYSTLLIRSHYLVSIIYYMIFLQISLFFINFSLAQLLIVISSVEISRKVGSDKGKVGGSKNDSKSSIQNQQNISSSWRHRLLWGRISQLVKIAALKEKRQVYNLRQHLWNRFPYLGDWGGFRLSKQTSLPSL